MTAPTALAGAPTTAHLPQLPALVDGHVWHSRRSPLRHGFRHRAFLWLVDVDDLPAGPWYLRPFSTFRSADHLGDGDGPLREKVERLVERHGVHLTDRGRVLMLANARVLGHVFDPLSVFWCFGGSGRLECVVAEVHNTYAERHVYVLRPDGSGLARADKQLYVSPFNDVSGRYELRFGLTPAEVSTAVLLLRGDDLVLSATFQGRCEPATPAAVLRAQLRQPLMPQRVSALIRMHGSWLWLRRLPVVPRPRHRTQEGV